MENPVVILGLGAVIGYAITAPDGSTLLIRADQLETVGKQAPLGSTLEPVYAMADSVQLDPATPPGSTLLDAMEKLSGSIADINEKAKRGEVTP